MESRYKTLIKNTVWTLFGNTGSKIIGFFLLPLYTKWLGTVGFGLSDLLSTYSSLLLGLMTLCLSDSIFVFTKNQSYEKKRRFYSSILYLAVFLLTIEFVLFLALKYFANSMNLKDAFFNHIWMIYGLVISSFVQQYVQQFVISQEKIKIYSFTGIVLCLLTFFLSWICIPKYGVNGYIYSLIASNLLTSIFTFFAAKSYYYIGRQLISKKELKDVLRYSIPLIPNVIMWWLVGALNRPIMEYHLGYSSIGLFAVASKFPSVITTVFGVFTVSWNISVFDEFKEKGFDDFYRKTFKTIFSLITLIAFIIICLSQVIISIFTSVQFHEAWRYMPFLIIGAVANCVSSFCGICFSVVKESKYLFYSSIYGAVTAIVLNFLLIPTFGIWGAVMSTMGAFLAMAISRYIYSRKIVKANLIPNMLEDFCIMLIAAATTLLIKNSTIRIIVDIWILSLLIYLKRKSINIVIKKIMTNLLSSKK
jgi:O-antigen/teichoic acid export membrane protein